MCIIYEVDIAFYNNFIWSNVLTEVLIICYYVFQLFCNCNIVKTKLEMGIVAPPFPSHEKAIHILRVYTNVIYIFLGEIMNRYVTKSDPLLLC